MQQVLVPLLAVGPGELAAIATAVCWAGSSIFFSSAGRRIGSDRVNRLRLLAAVLLLAAGAALTGAGFSMPWAQALLMAGSGLAGLALGDAALFEALVILGPRRTSLTQTLAPVFAALLMVPLLNESLGPVAIAGMVVTLAGVWIVIGERDGSGETRGNISRGIVLAVIGAIGQALGMVLAKAGLGAAPEGALLAQWAGLSARQDASGAVLLGQEVPAITATLVRMATAALVLMTITVLRRRTALLVAALSDRRGMALTMGGAVAGPVVGVTLSLVAVSYANTAVASTIIATSPVFVMLLVWALYGQRTTARGWLGAAVALAGVALLALRDVL